jgi:type IV secretion system protein VirB10
MVQSLKLGGAPKEEHGSGIRRLNRLPIIVVIVLGVAFLAVILYGLTSRGLYFRNDQGIGKASGKPATTFADQIKRGVSNGIIGEPQPQTTFQPTPAEDNEGAPATDVVSTDPSQREVPRTSQELEPEGIWRARLEREQEEQYLRERHRERMARLQANDAAYDAPIAVDRNKLTRRIGAQPTVAEGGGSGSSARSGARTTSDLYAAAMRAGLGGNRDPNNQQGKYEFFNADLKERGYLPNQVTPQQSLYELKRGSVIPATLITGINSDLPGRITAQVSQNVYDSATGHYLLIPQGTKLFGRYDSKVSFGQSRVLVVWTDVILPDGSTLQIGGMAGTDAQGYGGFRDKVDRKWLQTFGSAILVAVIGAGVDMAIPQDRNAFGSSNSAEDAARRNFAETFGRVADRTIQRNMDVQPTLKIRPGYKFNVLVDQDIVFPRRFQQ